MPTPKRDLSFFLSLAPPEVYDASKVRGNVPPEQKSLAINIFAYFVWSEDAWGCKVGRKIRLVEMNVWERVGCRKEGETVCEILVERDICNVHEVLAGGAIAHIIDCCSASSMIQLGLSMGVDTSGLSQSMNIIFHRAAPLGTKLRVVSTSMTVRGRIRAGRTHIYDADTNELLISGVHTTISPGQSKDKPKSKL